MSPVASIGVPILRDAMQCPVSHGTVILGGISVVGTGIITSEAAIMSAPRSKRLSNSNHYLHRRMTDDYTHTLGTIHH